MGEWDGKVFGVGLSRTGTTSLTAALSRLGYSVKHYPRLDEVLELAREYDALTDSSVVPWYKELDRRFDAKFVLTVRDVDEWLDSCLGHWGTKPIARSMDGWRLRNRVFNYGTSGFCREGFRRVYEAHVEDVRWWFRGRPDDLLVMDVCAGDGYEKLCPFLGRRMVRGDFPHRARG